MSGEASTAVRSYDGIDGIVVDIHSAADLLEALDALHSCAVEDLEGDPMYGECLGVLENGMARLRALLAADSGEVGG